jgi:dTDP-4-dehydrorhamnose 3,5-epimerase
MLLEDDDGGDCVLGDHGATCMFFSKCEVAGAWVVSPDPRADERGRFMRSWCREEFASVGLEFVPLQANMALSAVKGTLRGLHYQVAPALEAKLVRCTRGAVFDVVADVRSDSPTFRRWHGEHLNADNGRMLYVPEGCAHGCVSLEDATEIYYLASATYAPASARGLRFDDPAMGIQWPIEITVVSEQDRNWPLMRVAQHEVQRK